ncbi:saccharopine dehydrogenase family protein [Coralliovum pocilloporae]|uniref:saccharopine dehydrogenase family protein n=1 Tax=Coralliovum pocilloporae TaxID=3066369 RepID=UPI00330700AC
MIKTNVLLIGAGKIGQMIASLLVNTGDYSVTVIDANKAALDSFKRIGCNTVQCDVADDQSLTALMADYQVVLNATPFHLTATIAKAAAASDVHYFDLTEDVASTRQVKAYAAESKRVFMPQCGLAPGFISIAAADLAHRFETLDSLHLRVGALPLYPTNALKYNLTWSTDGLINEYCNPCEAIVDGHQVSVAPLEGEEHFSLDGVEYEAFNTSGGLGSLCETLDSKVRALDYKTVRYPGHLEICRLLVNELRLKDRRDILKDVLETAVPMTRQDVVLVFVTASGHRDGRFEQESFTVKVYADELYGEVWSAIQITTAAGICAVMDMVVTGILPGQGYLKQEDVPLDLFLQNRFGRLYQTEISSEELPIAAE